MTVQFLEILLIAIILVVVGIAFLVRRKAARPVNSISMLSVVVVLWIAAYLLYSVNPNWLSLSNLIGLHYFFLAAAASAQLFFSLSYTHRSYWLKPVTFILLSLEPLLTQIFFWVEPIRNELFLAGIGVWRVVNIIYMFHLLAASIFFFVDIFLNKPRSHFFRAGTILVGAIFPLVGTLFALVWHKDLEIQIPLTILSYALALAGFAYGIFNTSIVEMLPVTRDIVVEGMDDGWMVVDYQDRVIDVNSSVEKILGMSRENIYGLPVEQILDEWPKVSQPSDGVKEMELRRTSKMQMERRYLNLRISQLVDRNKFQFGHLIVWRDITGRKIADAIHQRARDELFVLLNAISSLASRSINLEDFLSEANYQIVYSFRSQGVATFLIDEKDDGKHTLLLKSQFGFSPEYVNVLGNKAITGSIHTWLTKNEENRPLIIDSQNPTFNLPLSPVSIGFDCITLIPLIIYTQHENNILGCLCLGRNDKSVYTQDEILRLTTIANQIATLIESNRRRQLAIVLGERQRLLRDLHDSVSQKLYGLVALTEAAQAGIEAGSKIAPVEVLSRIGENARQAVKEMRLFLYEMQPVDLKDGLVSSLQHRLAAVEGRADIKARMISDENIQLSKDNEMALYFIAQEALNNILRHAHAKNVSVNVKQTRRTVALEIKDDGQGFDVKKIDNSGLGLRNMKERAKQAGGKFTIDSKVDGGSGTKIVVSVPRKGS